MESARKVFTAKMRRKETKLNEYFEKKNQPNWLGFDNIKQF